MRNINRIWLKELRLGKRLTQTDVSVFCGITQQFYSAIENGRKNPSPLLAMKIAFCLGFEYERFFEDLKESVFGNC